MATKRKRPSNVDDQDKNDKNTKSKRPVRGAAKEVAVKAELKKEKKEKKEKESKSRLLEKKLAEYKDRKLPRPKPGDSLLLRTYCVPHDRISAAAWAKLRKELTLQPKEEDSHGARNKSFAQRKRWAAKKKEIQAWGFTNRWYILPPWYGWKHFGPPTFDCRPVGVTIDVPFEGKLWGKKDTFNQEQVMEQIQHHFTTHRPPVGGLLELPTSSGKTVILLYIITQILKKKALIISPMVPLHNQMGRRIPQFVPQARIGTIHGSTWDIKDKDIVIAMLHTLAGHTYPDTAFDDFGVVIFDEVDRIATRVFSRVLCKLGHIRILIGLSATVRRPDGMDRLFELYLGPYIYRAPISTKDSQATFVKRLMYHDGPQRVLMQRDETTIDACGMVRALTEDETRHSRLMILLNSLFAAGRRVIVLVTVVKYGERITQEAQAQHPDLKMIYYRRTLKPEEREVVDREPHSLIVATYQIFSIGVDVGYLDTLVMATPRKTITQAVGRLRSFSKFERKPCLILDIVDTFSIFQSQQYKRTKVYKERQYQELMRGEFCEAALKKQQWPEPNGVHQTTLSLLKKQREAHPDYDPLLCPSDNDS